MCKIRQKLVLISGGKVPTRAVCYKMQWLANAQKFQLCTFYVFFFLLTTSRAQKEVADIRRQQYNGAKFLLLRKLQMLQ